MNRQFLPARESAGGYPSPYYAEAGRIKTLILFDRARCGREIFGKNFGARGDTV
jgi:hypothetical protein